MSDTLVLDTNDLTQKTDLNPAITLDWDEELLQKYNVAGPRYTSYPTALEFSEIYLEEDYIECLQSVDENETLSLYIHIPFCQNICYYCACNKIITKHKDKAEEYVNYLLKEIELVAHRLAAKTLRQIHWGGGTPTYLSVAQIKRIMDKINSCFKVPNDHATEISIEVDPRALALDDVSRLAKLGFNRMSIGVQDFNFKVQKAINRIQPYEMTETMIEAARANGFQSINIDLIYGLPFQSVKTFEYTVKMIERLSPDRISVFNYAHLPHRFKPQRRINESDLPSAAEKLAIFQYIAQQLQKQGYRYIGMDHFAKPTDELAIAQQKGQLHRNFQGYTTHPEYNLIGVGVSSIGAVGSQYQQNFKETEQYYDALDRGQLPTWRGVSMSQEDHLRKAIIFELICHFQLNFNQIEAKFNLDFKAYFSRELELLAPMAEDGLLSIDDHAITVTPKGRLLIRNICMMFDAYLNEMCETPRFSKVI